MKKLILFAAILFAGVSVVSAQEHTDSKLTGTSDLVVNLKTIQSIIVQNQHQAVLNFNSMSDYATPEDVTSGEIKDHLSVYSTGKFSVSVNTESNSDELFDWVKVLVTKESQALANQLLTETEATLFTQENGGTNILYDVEYQATTGFDYMARVEGADTKIETVVTYTIAAK